MPRAFSTVVMLTLLVTAASAQTKPNFAGTWKLAGAAADQFTAPQMVVVQDAKMITVTATSQMGEFKTPFNLDGTELRAPLEFNGQSFDRMTKATWTDNKLMLTTKSEFNGQTFETKMTWTLNTDGTLLVESTRPDFQGGGAPVTSKATYKKGEAASASKGFRS